ncbi:cAMP-dependent protein kinase regulatory subunit isoform X2 [Physcomitrium patens]|uniref:cAMP-dependent protein kinase regulatory subunit isoform X2 n=1 Tax=Physcomitrium patens TaxID=3218 RepID=UPI000D1521E9|nr:cAMP-dependent protein kinase regulatory subunit-like isoform X2 [Physcomitrium patens]|eukprot:XP_024358631.1 cAMP-dependent protein kinase regulatory subunit-like isoform X2 [Physcomitrella patens]
MGATLGKVKDKRRRTLSFRRTGVSAEPVVLDSSYVPKVVKKSNDAKKRIQRALEKSYIFKGCDKKQIKTVIDAVEEEKHKAQDIIIQQSQLGDTFYFIEGGSCDVYIKQSENANPVCVASYSAGDSFGELALLYNAPRAATVKATTDCILWAMDRGTFQQILMTSTSQKRNLYEEFLASVPLLKTLDAYERSAIADVLEPEYYNPGQSIIVEDTPGDKFYFLEEGTAEAKTKGQVLMKYKSGDYFGELALLNNEPRAASVVTTSNCKVVFIERESFKRLLGKLEDILHRKKLEYATVAAAIS